MPRDAGSQSARDEDDFVFFCVRFGVSIFSHYYYHAG
jgi:hypothetical protein